MDGYFILAMFKPKNRVSLLWTTMLGKSAVEVLIDCLLSLTVHRLLFSLLAITH